MWSGFSIALVASVLAGDAWAAAVGVGAEDRRHHHRHRFPNPYYVIVGGGPSGYVLAEELSRDPTKNVILLEAGPDTAGNKMVDTPFFAPLLLQTQYTFNFTSQPDPNIQNQAPFLHQGRGTGGGSAVNYMGYCRGAASVYDQWAQISGNPQFQYKNFIQAYQATAHYTQTPLDYTPTVNPTAYGKGPLELTSPDDDLGFVLKLFQAWKNVLKLGQVDMNDGHGIGATTGVDSIRASNRTRAYAPQAYGWQLAGRPNVQVLVNSMATKIGFKGNQATNVTYVDGAGNSHTLTPREVIVSAGALNSPKLLLLSGVGPAADLQKLNIPVVADIAGVGQNLLDHHFSFMMYQVTDDVSTIPKYFSNATFKAQADAEYAQGGQGPLGVPPGAAFAIERAPDSVFSAVGDTYHPNLPSDRGQLLFQYAAAPLQQSPPPPQVNIISPFVALSQPQAAGSMKLASANYQDNPIINSNYYGSPGDKAAILYGYKQLREVIKDSSIAPKIVKEIFPGANVTSDAALWSAISTSAGTFHHPMGTNAMGSVVDGTTFRVKGLQGIRVVDSSIFPVMPDCHIMGETYATAWLAAQNIRSQDHY